MNAQLFRGETTRRRATCIVNSTKSAKDMFRVLSLPLLSPTLVTSVSVDGFIILQITMNVNSKAKIIKRYQHLNYS